MLYGFFWLQIFFTQYGTYYEYSWDIMEPICCLFTILDAIIAYTYWMVKNEDYSFETFESEYIQKKVNKILGRNILFSEEMSDIVAMINHMEVWKSLHNNDLSIILEALDDKFAKI